MSGAKSAATGRDVARCSPRQEAMEAREIAIVLGRDMMMQRHLTSVEPGSRTLDPASAAFVKPHEPATRRRMRGVREGLYRIKLIRIRTRDNDQYLVGLADCLAGPIIQSAVRQVDDQLVLVLDIVEPVAYRRFIE